MKVKITTLCENTVSRVAGITAQWGFSALVEVNGEKVLLDTGEGHSTMQNALLMHVDWTGMDRIVLSHAHGDHTGGLKDVLTHIDGIRLVRRAGGRKFSDIEPGQTITWTIEREGRRLTIETVLPPGTGSTGK